MKVEEVMSKKIITVKPTDTLEKVAKILFKKQVSGVLVVDAKEQLVGLVSEKDIYRMMYPTYQDFYNNPEVFLDHEAMEDNIKQVRDLPVEKFMKKEIVTLQPDDPVMKAGAIMLSRHINRLPVLKNNKVIGIVSRRDIYQNIFKSKLNL
ncbi:MAG: CBS domain-containing protein [Patescibacteria group bacterium]